MRRGRGAIVAPLASLVVVGASLSSSGCGAPPPPREAPKEAPPPPPPAPVVEQELGSIDEDAVERTFAKNGEALEACHSDGRARVPYLAGDVKLFLRIDRTGRVRYGFFEASSLGDRDTEKCILAALSAVSFPAPIGGEAEVRHGFGWEGGQERAPAPFDADKIQKALASAAGVRSRVEQCKRGARGDLAVTAYVEPGGKGKKSRGGAKGHFRALGVAASTRDAADKSDCLVAALRELPLPSPGSFAAKVTFSP